MSDVGKCFDLESKADGLACVKQVIREYKGSCGPRLVLLTKKDCPYCEQEKKIRKQELESGEITQIDVFSTEGKDIVKKNDMDAVPALVVIDCNNYLIS